MSRRRGGRPQQTRQMPTREQAQRYMDGEEDARLLPLIRGREIDAGDLSGEYVAPVTASFTYFGKRFRVNPDLTETMVVDLLEAGESIEVDDPRNLLAAKDYAREHLHPEDFEEFWDTARANRQDIRALMRVCWRLLEQVTDRPTTPPSGSSDGRPDTRTNSPDGASGQDIESSPAPAEHMAEISSMTGGTGNAREVGEYFARKFEAEGRPDKAAQVMLAVEAREARGLVTV